MNGERRFEKRDGWNMARYIGRYVKHPPIAESRIMNFDGNQVTYWYEDSGATRGDNINCSNAIPSIRNYLIMACIF